MSEVYTLYRVKYVPGSLVGEAEYISDAKMNYTALVSLLSPRTSSIEVSFR